jgi:3-dehydroquinate synthase class II
VKAKEKKWDKAKVIFTFAMDKGIDAALAFLPMMNFLK